MECSCLLVDLGRDHCGEWWWWWWWWDLGGSCLGWWGLDLLCDGGEDGLGRGGLLGRGLGRRSVLIRWDQMEQMEGWGAVIPLFLLGGIRIRSLSLTRTECPLCPWYP